MYSLNKKAWAVGILIMLIAFQANAQFSMDLSIQYDQIADSAYIKWYPADTQNIAAYIIKGYNQDGTVVLEQSAPAPQTYATIQNISDAGVTEIDITAIDSAASTLELSPKQSLIKQISTPGIIESDTDMGIISMGNGTCDLEIILEQFDSGAFPMLYATVKINNNGVPEPNFTADQFEVFENGILQDAMFEVTPPGQSGGVRIADIVFLIDTSGSMGPYITAVKNNCIAFANALAASNIDYRLGLIQFGNMSGPNPGIIGGGLTDDAEQFKSWVGTLSATGGYEPGYEAINLAIQNFNFRTGSQKHFMLITDEDADGSLADTLNLVTANQVKVHVAANCNYYYSNEHYCGPASVRDVSGGLLFNVTGNYTQILDEIGQTIANTYKIRYKTSAPDCDGTLREVDIVVTDPCDPACTATATTSYQSCGAPIITRTPDTIALHSQNHLVGDTLTIAAQVQDFVTPYVQAVTLFVRTTGNAAWQQIPMPHIGGEIYSVQIPISLVLSPGVDYYIRATDGEVTSADPSNEPANNPYQLAVMPNIAPLITHTPPANADINQDCPLDISADDATDGIAKLQLFYRAAGELLWKCVEQTAQPSQPHLEDTFPIPAAHIQAPAMEYYIKATDNHGVSSCWSNKTADNPYVLNVLDIYVPGEIQEKIVFSGKFLPGDGNDLDIFMVDANGCDDTVCNLLNLTAAFDGQARRPSISPDGTKIAFDVNNTQLWIMSANCYELVADFGDTCVKLMDFYDNDTLAYTKCIDDCVDKAYLINLDGTGETLLFPDPFMNQQGVLDFKVSYDFENLAASWKWCCWDYASSIFVHLYDGSYGWVFYNDPTDSAKDDNVIWSRNSNYVYWRQEGTPFSEKYIIKSRNLTTGAIRTVRSTPEKLIMGALSPAPNADQCLLFANQEVPGDNALTLLNLASDVETALLTADTIGVSDWGGVDSKLTAAKGQKPLTVLFPNTNAKIVASQCKTVIWETADWIEIPSVVVRFDCNDQGCLQSKFPCIRNLGKYCVKFPNVDSNDCVIRVISCAYPCLLQDESDEPFELYQCSCDFLPGDLNKDCYVNCKDAAVLAKDWLENTVLPMPIAHWTFEEMQGNIAYDITGNGYDLELVNAGFSSGIIDCGALDTRLGYATTPDDPNLRLGGSYTIAGWIKKDDNYYGMGAYWDMHTIIAKTYCQSYCVGSWDMRVNPDPNFLGMVEDESDDGASGFGTDGAYVDGGQLDPSWGMLDPNDPNINWGEWTHLAVVYSHRMNIAAVFVNGCLIRVGPWETKAGQCNAPVTVGTNHINSYGSVCSCWSGFCNHFFQGDIDDLRIYNTALTPGQICALHAMSGRTAPCRYTNPICNLYPIDPDCFCGTCREITDTPHGDYEDFLKEMNTNNPE